ncbi:TPA: FosX/FosE/FosI family fosfomycin resistance thiol transferase [Enterococcus faecium]|uniref:FosX/FosE/FosI family fosfomycin resistance hydrolase n=2 Tax=Enterococcus faecium TaxID=1352 RepID=UPI0011576FF3|nr:FosX/FosE/FosI family fosfomycin resistance hydrolase [Enterococcus faecium]EGP4989614.1 FosX/FosE/FosI family fosfomycin resistance thiol transferase [Enterococcus faecium]EHG8745562.1 FosX/FosE/FosI family fosfomycin resistance thiol transferase [Enterococcus faecium]EHG8747551.1 FosX/FosE/FosI family fosfomycin resistance thiol transferase [Enterococcus faecium]EME3440455.1 FosX/FosE/FosI family fosfomycin resistance thiol transferase [Enterococcus faecium]EME3440685.1 FosX/FosE/FosI fam
MEISHITLIVKDLNKTSVLLNTLFDAKEIYDSQQKKFSLYPEKFFLVKDLWIAVMQDSSNKLPKTYNHIAFKIDEQDIDSFVSKIQMLGLTVEPGRSRVKGEASSIYFYDYDNHLFELHTGTLQERLKSYNSTT